MSPFCCGAADFCWEHVGPRHRFQKATRCEWWIGPFYGVVPCLAQVRTHFMTFLGFAGKKPKTIEHGMNYEQVYLKPLVKKWI